MKPILKPSQAYFKHTLNIKCSPSVYNICKEILQDTYINLETLEISKFNQTYFPQNLYKILVREKKFKNPDYKMPFKPKVLDFDFYIISKDELHLIEYYKSKCIIIETQKDLTKIAKSLINSFKKQLFGSHYYKIKHKQLKHYFKKKYLIEHISNFKLTIRQWIFELPQVNQISEAFILTILYNYIKHKNKYSKIHNQFNIKDFYKFCTIKLKLSNEQIYSSRPTSIKSLLFKFCLPNNIISETESKNIFKIIPIKQLKQQVMTEEKDYFYCMFYHIKTFEKFTYNKFKTLAVRFFAGMPQNTFHKNRCSVYSFISQQRVAEKLNLSQQSVSKILKKYLKIYQYEKINKTQYEFHKKQNTNPNTDDYTPIFHFKSKKTDYYFRYIGQKLLTSFIYYTEHQSGKIKLHKKTQKLQTQKITRKIHIKEHTTRYPFFSKFNCTNEIEKRFLKYLIEDREKTNYELIQYHKTEIKVYKNYINFEQFLREELKKAINSLKENNPSNKLSTVPKNIKEFLLSIEEWQLRSLSIPYLLHLLSFFIFTTETILRKGREICNPHEYQFLGLLPMREFMSKFISGKTVKLNVVSNSFKTAFKKLMKTLTVNEILEDSYLMLFNNDLFDFIRRNKKVPPIYNNNLSFKRLHFKNEILNYLTKSIYHFKNKKLVLRKCKKSNYMNYKPLKDRLLNINNSGINIIINDSILIDYISPSTGN